MAGPKASSSRKGAPAKPRADGPSPGKRRKAVPAAIRREQILEVAREVFLKSGLAGARTQELADKAGINQGVLFRHFESKEQLFYAAIVEPIQKVIQTEIENSDNYKLTRSKPYERAMNLNGHLTFIETISELFPLLMTALFSDRESGFEFYGQHMVPWLKSLSDIQTAAFDGHQRKEISSEAIVLTSLGAYLMFTLDAYFRRTRVDVESVASQVTEIFNAGIFDPATAPETATSTEKLGGARSSRAAKR